MVAVLSSKAIAVAAASIMLMSGCGGGDDGPTTQIDSLLHEPSSQDVHDAATPTHDGHVVLGCADALVVSTQARLNEANGDVYPTIDSGLTFRLLRKSIDPGLAEFMRAADSTKNVTELVVVLDLIVSWCDDEGLLG